MGIAGLTLGSGSGWLERKCGITCESLISAEVVTADGRLLRASADENPDLFWGLKGGGGNFGVVTEFEFRLHPIGPIVYAGMILHPRDAAPELLRFYRDFIAQAPDEVGGALALLTAPPENFVPQEARGRPATGLIVLYAGDPQQGEQLLRPLVDWGQPWVKMVQPMPYAAVQQMTDPANPWGISEYFKIDYLRDLPDDAIEALVEKASEIRSPFTGVYVCPLGGAVARTDRSAMAADVPDARFFYFCQAMWWDPADGDGEIEWARGFMETMRPWAVQKALPNFVSHDEGARLRASYGDEKFERLVALKDKYDPDNVFSLNQNIPPSMTPA
jgi:FAD/FMN-containing dehydrogenase